MTNQADYYICPGCGDDVRVGSQGCPKCNNLDPWEIEDTEIYDGLDLPEDPDMPVRQHTFTIKPLWIITAAILLLAIIFGFIL